MSEESGPVALSEARTVLLLGAPHDEAVGDGCRNLIHGGDEDHVIVVLLARSPREWIEWWERHEGSLPEELVFVTTGEPPSGLPPGTSVERVSSPTDLTALGIRAADHLERWAERGIKPSLCFDSLTVLLQYVDIETAYKFMYALSTRVANADARAHVHLDPRTMDEQTLSTVESIFSAVARHDGDGWNVGRR
jgi:hypothetical protein